MSSIAITTPKRDHRIIRQKLTVGSKIKKKPILELPTTPKVVKEQLLIHLSLAKLPVVLSFTLFVSLFLLDLPDEKEKNASTEISEKENVSNKNCGTKPGYKYVEVVRKKDDRAKLNGYKCRDCQEVTYLRYS